MTDRVRRLCSEDTVDKEFLFARQVFINNGHPERLLDKCIKQQQQQDKVSLVAKKIAYNSLSFKGDTQTEIISGRLSTTVRRTFCAANLHTSFTSFPALKFHLTDEVPSCAVSFCVCSFTCSCGACYIGRTTRHLSVRACEHHPAWLSSGVTKSIKSSVLAHSVYTGHSINIKQSFQIDSTSYSSNSWGNWD